MSSDLRAYVSRYVVPFYFEYENNGYEKLRRHFTSDVIDNQSLGLPKDGQWANVGFWENYKSDNESQGEMDIYSYLPSIFLEERKANGTSISNLGVSFVYKSNGKLFELEYRGKEKNIVFDCKHLGLLLFRNGIGFIWYETEFKKEVSIDEYVGFQHDFKELARTHGEKFVKKITIIKDSVKDPKKVKKEDIETKYESFCLGEWLSKIVAANDLGIRFWAERETKFKDGNKARIPDKALLFQYLFVEQRVLDQEKSDQEKSKKESNNLVFRIANGYDEKYNAPGDIEGDLYKPFGNACFYVSKAGMACVVNNINSNETFFDGQFREKYVRDYFFIYMLLIYQSYSCAHYSRLLTKLPADEKLFNKKAAYVDKLESLNGQINLFLVKSVFESVSNIHHQNGMYRYGKGALCIEDDIQSLTIGLDALKDMEREKRDRKVDIALVVFGFMVVVSAWIDGLNLVDWFMKSDGRMNLWHIIISGGIVILTVYLIATLLWNRKKK